MYEAHFKQWRHLFEELGVVDAGVLRLHGRSKRGPQSVELSKSDITGYKYDVNYKTFYYAKPFQYYIAAVTTENGISSDLLRKSTAPLEIKISAAQLNLSNVNILKVE